MEFFNLFFRTIPRVSQVFPHTDFKRRILNIVGTRILFFLQKYVKRKKVGQTIFSLNLDGTLIARYVFKAIPKTKRKSVSYLCKDADEALGFAAESQLIDQLVARNY